MLPFAVSAVGHFHDLASLQLDWLRSTPEVCRNEAALSVARFTTTLTQLFDLKELLEGWLRLKVLLRSDAALAQAALDVAVEVQAMLQDIVRRSRPLELTGVEPPEQRRRYVAISKFADVAAGVEARLTVVSVHYERLVEATEDADRIVTEWELDDLDEKLAYDLEFCDVISNQLRFWLRARRTKAERIKIARLEGLNEDTRALVKVSEAAIRTLRSRTLEQTLRQLRPQDFIDAVARTKRLSESKGLA